MGIDRSVPSDDYKLTSVELYWLMWRLAATLTIWDAYSVEPPSNPVLLPPLKNASPHYDVYDRGSCLVAVPKDLFSHERTRWDALETAKAMALKVHELGWSAVELAGFHSMVRASWVEMQILNKKYGRSVEVLHYEPTAADYTLYKAQEKAQESTLGKAI